MAQHDDPALYSSNYERNENDQYWTGKDESACIAKRIPGGVTNVWEPCAGRGDLARVIQDFGFNVFCSDIDTSNFDQAIGTCEPYDFLKDETPPSFFIENDIHAIITNTPFGDEAEACVRKALTYSNVRFFAFFLRAEWNHAKGRRDLFDQASQPFCREIVLTWRPRWDWWFREKAFKSPRHNFSWFTWDRENPNQPQEWASRSK